MDSLYNTYSFIWLLWLNIMFVRVSSKDGIIFMVQVLARIIFMVKVLAGEHQIDVSYAIGLVTSTIKIILSNIET